MFFEDTAVLSAIIDYDEDNNIFLKSYGSYNLSYSNTYDEDGNIIADENNQYTYDTAGELTSVTGNSNSSYTYDSRGNILSKTVNGETTAFLYNTDEWKDQLISVGGEALTYDDNGNLISYDLKEYTWSHGKRLESVTDGENKYYYSYDSNGIRTSKSVNGVYTDFDVMNGKILAQYSDTDKICFQYNNDTPIGFILNDVQYLYLTDLSGDVAGITDAQGNLIATYEYDEWGKLLSIETAEEDNAEQLEIATINPLRYRGYYFDTDLGAYYLQSRYYMPDVHRFLNADLPEYAKEQKGDPTGTNLFAYCCNDPVNNSDPNGFSKTYTVTIRYYGTAGSNVAGHIDISFGGRIYTYGDYSSETDKADKSNFMSGNVDNYLISSKVKNRKKRDTVKLKFNSKEYNRIYKFYNTNLKYKASKNKYSKKYKINRYVIYEGKYKNYNFLIRNCATMVCNALEYALQSKASNTIVKYIQYLGNLNLPKNVTLLAKYIKIDYKM